MVKQVFITFRFKDIQSISIADISTRLLSLDPYAKVIGVQEHNKQGIIFHYHFLVIFKVGFPKATYRSLLRDLFPFIRGHGFDVSGVRNLSYTVNYILKDVKRANIIHLNNVELRYFLKISKKVELVIYISIIRFEGSFEEWKDRSIDNLIIYYKSPKKVLLIWDDIQLSKIVSIKTLKEQIISLQAPIVTWDYSDNIILPREQCTLLIKLCLNLFKERKWKRTNILLSGAPNTGKTTLFKIFELHFNFKFYWASARPGDITGFSPKNGIIILDDVITIGNQWPEALILKMLGREGFLADAKIVKIIDIPAGIPVIVITNYHKLFLISVPIEQRLIHINLVDEFSWTNLSKEQFIYIFRVVIEYVKRIDEEKVLEWRYYKSNVDFNIVLLKELDNLIYEIRTAYLKE